jgi:hypothetical protein
MVLLGHSKHVSLYSKSKLSSLFGAEQAAFNSSKNDSLTYTAPKQPKKQAGRFQVFQINQVLHSVTKIDTAKAVL